MDKADIIVHGTIHVVIAKPKIFNIARGVKVTTAF